MAFSTAATACSGSPDVRTTSQKLVGGPCTNGTYVCRGVGLSTPYDLTSATTPTTSSQGEYISGLPVLKRLPIGFSPGQMRRANVSLMTATVGDFTESVELNHRPCNNRMPIASK